MPEGAYPYDVAAGPDGVVWYAGQRLGVVGKLDPATGKVEHVPLGAGSSPHGIKDAAERADLIVYLKTAVR